MVKRLLGLLMILVMTVLLLPSAAGADSACPCCHMSGVLLDNGGTDITCTYCCYKATRYGGIVKVVSRCTPGDWIVVKEATDTEPGRQVRRCVNCGRFTDEAIIPAGGGTPGGDTPGGDTPGGDTPGGVIPGPNSGCSHTNVVIDPAVEPTCTKSGWTEGSHCGTCGAVLKEQLSVPALGHLYAKWVPAGNGKHATSCLRNCGYTEREDCQTIELPIAGAAVTLCPVCGACNGAEAEAVKGLKVGEGAPYRGTLRVWLVTADENNKCLTFSFDRFGKLMQPEGEVTLLIPDNMKGDTTYEDGTVVPAQETDGTLKLDFGTEPIVMLKVN